MRVSTASQPQRDPTLDRIRIAAHESNRLLLISAPPGFGKSSTLHAASYELAHDLPLPLIWISGGIIASTAHLVRTLAHELREAQLARASLANFFSEVASLDRQFVLAIDDLDSLIFKREDIAESLAGLIASNAGVRVLATSNSSATERIVSGDGPFARVLHGGIQVISLPPLDAAAAANLIRRRAPRIEPCLAERVIDVAGGHPAALVYLARLAQIGLASAESNFDAFLDVASEFAGAVYAESWTSLGPQQRALLWQLSDGTAKTAGEVAEATGLSASHVSSQFTRLLAEGLVTRGLERGQFKVAPLLSSWILRRAARSAGRASTQSKRGSALDGHQKPRVGIAAVRTGRKRHGRI